MTDIFDEISTLKTRENATILAHYYQEGEIQQLADYTGDSLKLARAATQVETGRKMILWNGACMVHEIFSVGDLLDLKRKMPHAITLAHPECPANIREHSEFVGGTEAMIKYIGGFKDPTDFLVATEANMM